MTGSHVHVMEEAEVSGLVHGPPRGRWSGGRGRPAPIQPDEYRELNNDSGYVGSPLKGQSEVTRGHTGSLGSLGQRGHGQRGWGVGVTQAGSGRQVEYKRRGSQTRRGQAKRGQVRLVQNTSHWQRDTNGRI